MALKKFAFPYHSLHMAGSLDVFPIAITRERANIRRPFANAIRNGGFTLVELVIAIVLIGILSAVVITNINAKPQHSVTVQADEFRRNLSHIQLLAISQGARLKLTVASGGYNVTSCPTSACGGTVTDPAQSISVALTDGVTFTQGAGDYYFDTLGRPVAAATGAALKLGTSLFTLSGSGRSVSVTVLPITGFAQTAY